MKFDRSKFYSGYRNAFTKLNQEQVDGLNILLDAIENDPKWNSLSEVAYVLSTIKHETADTFQPITERGGRAYFNKYEPPRAKARELGNVNEGDGYLYRGRGFVQITGRTNYRKFGIEDDPDKALEPGTAYRIISEGMRKGSFTGKRLSNYIDSDSADYRQARRIVNGLDKAAHIAKLAEQFENILESSLVQVPATNTPEHATPPLPDSKDDEGVTKTQDVAPSPVNVEHADKVVSSPAPLSGASKDDPPKEIEKVKPSLPNRIAAGAAAVVTPLTALGLKIGSVEVSQGVIIALCLLAAVGIVTGAWVWNKSAERAAAQTARNQEVISDPGRQNVIVK